MFGLGGQEIAVILLIVVVLFGAKRLPELARAMGESIKEFKKSSRGVLDDDDSEKSEKTEKASKPGS